MFECSIVENGAKSLPLRQSIRTHRWRTGRDGALDFAPAVATEGAHDRHAAQQWDSQSKDDEGRPNSVDDQFGDNEDIEVFAAMVVEEGRDEGVDRDRVGAVIKTVWREPRPEDSKKQAGRDEEA